MKKINLKVENVSKCFSSAKKDNKILNQISLDFIASDFTIIMGSSGAGKSTLLYVMNGMEKASEGSVIYGDMDITAARI